MTSRTAVLVIATTTQPVYRHYIATHWTELIRHTNEHCPDLDVFLLIEHGLRRGEFAHIEANVIEDATTDARALVEPRHRRPGVPSILSKTIHALDVLQGEYDVFFRTNLSSMINLAPFRRFVHERKAIKYSGAWIWDDALRSDLVEWGWVGAGKVVEDLSELDNYPGNTFVSGSGFFLNATEAAHLVSQRDQMRWASADDVSIGLLLDEHEQLEGFSEIVKPSEPIDTMVKRLCSTRAPHVRLQHFPLATAEMLWRKLETTPSWAARP